MYRNSFRAQKLKISHEFLYIIYLTDPCKERFGIDLGGGDKTDTHICLLTRVRDRLFGWHEIFLRIILRFILGRHVVRN